MCKGPEVGGISGLSEQMEASVEGLGDRERGVEGAGPGLMGCLRQSLIHAPRLFPLDSDLPGLGLFLRALLFPPPVYPSPPAGG